MFLTQAPTVSPDSIDYFVFVMQMQCIFCKAEAALLHMNEILDFKNRVMQEVLSFISGAVKIFWCCWHYCPAGWQYNRVVQQTWLQPVSAGRQTTKSIRPSVSEGRGLICHLREVQSEPSSLL
jgi:hypothetical protein